MDNHDKDSVALHLPDEFRAWAAALPDRVRQRLSIHELRMIWQPIERLQRALADTVDMLKQCAERNDEIESHNERLERDLSESKRALLVPGVMSCAKCNFRLYRRNLYMQSGTVGPGGNETEPCPNGCGPLWPVTWKREASENLTLAEEAHADRAKAERERDEARAELRNVDRLRGVRVIQNDGVYLDSTEVVVDIDDDPPHSQWHGSGRTVREALWRACRGKDRAALGGEG